MYIDSVIHSDEIGGIRNAHLGESRAAPNEWVLKALEDGDVLVVNIDSSQHSPCYEPTGAALKRIRAKVGAPGHY